MKADDYLWTMVLNSDNHKGAVFIKEIIFQVILHLVVFLFSVYDRNHPQIDMYEVVFFLNYALAGFIINYFFLPRFLYKKKYLSFSISIILTLIAVILIEEFVLEKIYFPNSRGSHFSGFFYCLIEVLPVITILSGFKFAWDALRKQAEVDNLKSAVKESELQYLKSQINPHFLFNNLNNLYAYAIEKSPKTPEIILELSGLLRYMLYECKEAYVPLAKEINQLKNFINLNEMQIEERGEVKFNAHGRTSGYQIAPLILTVFVENAFKHSTASQSDNISIQVELKVSDQGQLDFTCKNSYREQTNTDNLSKGIGLENVKKRLQLLYPEAHHLAIQQSESIYEVNLQMDLNKMVQL